MDIGVLNPYFYPYKGGTEKVLLEVYRRLAKHHNVTVITSTMPGMNCTHKEEIDGINVIRLKTHQYTIPGLPLPFESFEILNSQIKSTGADLFHVNNRYQYFYFNIKNIKEAGKLCLTIHNSLPTGIDRPTDFFGRLYDRAWGRRMMHHSDLITGVSKDAIKVTVPEEDQNKAHVVYNGVDYRNFIRHSKRDSKVMEIREELGFDGPIILCNGRLVPQKGQTYLMRAMGMLPKGKRPNLLLLGKGPMEGELRDEAKQLGIKLQIRSDLCDKELPYYYSACDIAVMPSLYEPASLAALESMACELPIIASKVGGLPEMVGPCGLYARPKDPKSLRDALSWVLSNPKEARQMGRSGRRRVISRHSWDKITSQYEKLFLNTVR